MIWAKSECMETKNYKRKCNNVFEQNKFKVKRKQNERNYKLDRNIRSPQKKSQFYRTYQESMSNLSANFEQERNLNDDIWETEQAISFLHSEMCDLPSEQCDQNCEISSGASDSDINEKDLRETSTLTKFPSYRATKIDNLFSSYNNADCEAPNLSWLLNFKVESLFNNSGIKHENSYRGPEDNTSVYNEGLIQNANPRCPNNATLPNKVQTKESGPWKAFHSGRYKGPMKPPFTYTELIEQALREEGELTVSGIYNWISEHFPFYKANDDRWKNSVRHNLSINPHFRKGVKAPHGAGHLWTVAHKEGQTRFNLKKQQQQQISQFGSDIVSQDEVAAATASIEENKENRDILLLDSPGSPSIDPELSPLYTDSFITDGVTLEQSAEEILSGVKKQVEVQYLIPVKSPSASRSDYLNSISNDIIVQESGLLDKNGDIEGSFLITDLNPVALELNMDDTEIILPDNLFGDEMGFQFFELSSAPPQLQV